MHMVRITGLLKSKYISATVFNFLQLGHCFPAASFMLPVELSQNMLKTNVV